MVDWTVFGVEHWSDKDWYERLWPLEVDGTLGGSSKSESSSELSDINSTLGFDLLYIELASGNSKSESLLRG